MYTFQIEKKARAAACKVVEAEGRQGEPHREQQIEPRKYHAKERLKDSFNGTAVKGVGEERKEVIQKPPCRAQKGAHEKAVEGAHLKRAESLFFAAP